MSQSALPNPLDEKQAEIERLQRLIEVKDLALQAARDWLEPVIYPDEKQLHEVLSAALECQ